MFAPIVWKKPVEPPAVIPLYSRNTSRSFSESGGPPLPAAVPTPYDLMRWRSLTSEFTVNLLSVDWCGGGGDGGADMQDAAVRHGLTPCRRQPMKGTPRRPPRAQPSITIAFNGGDGSIIWPCRAASLSETVRPVLRRLLTAMAWLLLC